MKKYLDTELYDGVTAMFIHKNTCPLCKPFMEMALTLEAFFSKEGVRFVRLLAEEPNLELCEKLGVDQVPCLVIFVHDKIVNKTYSPVRTTELIKEGLTEWKRQIEKQKRESVTST